MKTIRLILFGLLATGLVTSCGKTSYKKTPGGMPYKIFRGKDTQYVRMDNVLKITLEQKINDSVLFTTAGSQPMYMPVLSQNFRLYDVAELWTMLRKGDSVETVQMMDTFIKKNPMGFPPQFKKGDRIITRFRILDIFANDSLAKADEKKYKDKALAAEISEVEKYLAEKKITAQRTPSGAFVEIIKPGSGREVDTGAMVTINYTGTSWSGKRFDSNTDTSFGHAEPYSYPAGERQMIQGFDEAVLMVRKGAVIRTYIPAELGYGAAGREPNIKKNEHLIFDIEILEVADKPQAIAPPPPPVQKN